MAKYTATIDEDTRKRIQALPGRVHFPAFMQKAITIFVEELEKNPDLRPENFIITHTARVTKRKQIEEALLKVNAFNQSIIDSSTDCIKLLDLEGRLQYMSPGGQRLLRIQEIGKYLNVAYQEFWKGTDHHAALEAIHQAQQGHSGRFRGYCPTVDGTPKWWDVIISPIVGPDGKPERLLAVSRDITERRQAEAALQASSDRYRSYIEVTGQLGWTTNPDGEVNEDLPSWRLYTGQTYEELKGRGWSKALHPDDLEHTLQIWKKAVTGKSSYETEYRIRRHDGVYRHFMARGIPVLREDGSVREWVGTCIDITERKRAEELLLENEGRLKRSQEIAHLGSWELDLVNNRLYWSDEVYRIFGLQPQEFDATYEAFLEAVHPDDRMALDAAYSGSLQEGRDTYEIEHRVIRKYTGEIRYVHEKCDHFRDKNGRIIRSVGMVHDITERKRTEEEVKKLNENLRHHVLQLEAANRELEAFSYSVSHDLRSPLRSVAGFSQSLFDDYADKLDAEGRDSLERILAATQRMGLLIDDLLNLSRVSRAEMKREEVNLSGLAGKIADMLMKTQPERQAEFHIAEGLVAQGDEHLLTVVLENLLGNAWKFTGKKTRTVIEFGAIDCRMQNADCGIPNNNFEIRNLKSGIVYFVKDNGAGFDMSYAGKMFSPFQRLHSVNEFPGTGIGLATVKRIINRHGGSVWIEAEVGKGTTVYFTI